MLKSTSISNSLSVNLRQWLKEHRFSITTIILLVCLVAFEMFNYSTTDFALKDLLGDLKFLGVFWSTILAIAFCGIDFAGIASLFTPEDQRTEQKEMWFLFGAWLIAATMNALLTWWGVSISIANHVNQSSAIIDAHIINQYVPIFVAIMVWVTRILLIGSFTYSSHNSFSTKKSFHKPISTVNPKNKSNPTGVLTNMPSNTRSSPVNASFNARQLAARPEPEYISENSGHSKESVYQTTKSSGQQGIRRF